MGAIGLEELLSGGRRHERQKQLSHEVQVVRLKDALERYTRGNPFKVGDLVTPVAESRYQNQGDPHIVIGFINPPKDDDGYLLDTRIAHMHGDSVYAHEIASSDFEPWEQRS